MKNNVKYMGTLTVMILLLIFVMPNNVSAWQTSEKKLTSINLITLPWHLRTPNLCWKFSFFNTGQVDINYYF